MAPNIYQLRHSNPHYSIDSNQKGSDCNVYFISRKHSSPCYPVPQAPSHPCLPPPSELHTPPRISAFLSDFLDSLRSSVHCLNSIVWFRTSTSISLSIVRRILEVWERICKKDLVCQQALHHTYISECSGRFFVWRYVSVVIASRPLIVSQQVSCFQV